MILKRSLRLTTKPLIFNSYWSFIMKYLTQVVSFYGKIKQNKWAYRALCLLAGMFGFVIVRMCF